MDEEEFRSKFISWLSSSSQAALPDDLLVAFGTEAASQNLVLNGHAFPTGKKLESLEFPGSLEFNGCTFFGSIEISNCKFRRELRIQGCSVGDKIVLRNSNLGPDAKVIGNRNSVAIEVSKCSGHLKVRTGNNEPISIVSSTLDGIELDVGQSYTQKINFEGSTFTSDFHTGSLKLPAGEGALSFNNSSFLGAFHSARGWTQNLDFSNATFNGPVVFDSQMFSKPVSFRSSKFLDAVGMDEVHFNGGVDFSGALFLASNKAQPDLHLNIRSSGLANFSKVFAERPLILSGSIFYGKFDLSDAQLMSGANFSGSTFKDAATFERVNCKETLRFAGTMFQESVNFTHATIQHLWFRVGEIDASTDLSRSSITTCDLTDCVFLRGLECEDAKIKSFFANNAKFKARVSFARTEFLAAPFFHESVFFQDSSFSGAKFKDLVTPGAEGAYRTLKQKMDGLKNEAEEAVFGALELNCRRKKLHIGSNLWEWFFSYSYYLINNYGRSLIRPAIWLTAVFLLFAFVFSSTDSAVDFPVGINPKYFSLQKGSADLISGTWLQSAMDNEILFPGVRMRGAVHSMFNTLGPLRLFAINDALIPSSFNMQMLSFMQSFISTILIYVFIVGIRRRFKTLA